MRLPELLREHLPIGVWVPITRLALGELGEQIPIAEASRAHGRSPGGNMARMVDLGRRNRIAVTTSRMEDVERRGRGWGMELRRLPRELPRAYCQFCGTSIVLNVAHRRFCSDLCSVRFRRAQERLARRRGR